MTSTRTMTRQLTGIVAILVAAISLTLTAKAADAAMNASVTATCYSDGYMTISDGGNVQPQAKYLQLHVRSASTGWKWRAHAWRPISGSTFRLNATKGATYHLWARIATKTSTGWSYSGGYIPVTNVNVSPIGAVNVDSRTLGDCKT